MVLVIDFNGVIGGCVGCVVVVIVGDCYVIVGVGGVVDCGGGW